VARDSDPNEDRALVGIVRDRRDVAILNEKRWYRVPTSAAITTGPSWPPAWFAPFETSKATGSHQQVRRYAKVIDIQVQTREELFPGVPGGQKANRRHYQLRLGPIEELAAPLVPHRPRRWPFVETTIKLLRCATDFNDLFRGNPVEDRLWDGLAENLFEAERQWPLRVADAQYFLDFASFCNERDLDVEVDGRPHHSVESRSSYDADRDAALATQGWSVQRFRADTVRSERDACIAMIGAAVEKCGGLREVPVKYVATPRGLARQMKLLEERTPYGGEAHQ
jgi:very-short-patch-repair endonuclease